eukprot:scaffold33273_cov62-Phaeocystis_antarctica.AAC.12
MRLWRESYGPPRARKRSGATLGGPLSRRRFLGRLVYFVELCTQPGLEGQRRSHRRLGAGTRAPPQPLLVTQEARSLLSGPGGSPGQPGGLLDLRAA